MRDFFRTELKRIHLTAGLQQYNKLQDAEITELLDILCAECAKFPLIPDKDKEAYIREWMKADPEFIGFNQRWLWKWLNVVNRNYIVSQADFSEDKKHAPASPEIADKWLEEWRRDLSKIGNPQPRTDNIKDQRIQDLKDNLAAIECKHPKEVVQEVNGTIYCLDCGQRFETMPVLTPKAPN